MFQFPIPHPDAPDAGLGWNTAAGREIKIFAIGGPTGIAALLRIEFSLSLGCKVIEHQLPTVHRQPGDVTPVGRPTWRPHTFSTAESFNVIRLHIEHLDGPFGKRDGTK